MRLFIAIELSSEIRAALGGMIDALRTYRVPVKWVEPKNIHVTLKFIGELPDAKLKDVVAVMSEAAVKTPVFRIELIGGGAFPDLRRPRVLFVEMIEQPLAAADLAGRLDEALKPLGVESEEREFQSHVTLGRLREPQPIGEMAAKLEELTGRSLGVMKVENITLIKSTLTPVGPIYEPLERAGLGGWE